LLFKLDEGLVDFRRLRSGDVIQRVAEDGAGTLRLLAALLELCKLDVQLLLQKSKQGILGIRGYAMHSERRGLSCLVHLQHTIPLKAEELQHCVP
jgi:hypothetical protein